MTIETIQPWFDPMRYGWLPGTLVGLASVLLGALAGLAVRRGRARQPVVAACWSMTGLSILLLAAGTVAISRGQPWGVSSALALPGLIGTAVIGGVIPSVLRRYRVAEERRLAAQDL
jgi:hypothetical protein